MVSFSEAELSILDTGVEEVRVVDFWAGCDRINDRVHLSSCGPCMVLEVGFTCTVCLADLQKKKKDTKKKKRIPFQDLFQLRNSFQKEMHFQFRGAGCHLEFCKGVSFFDWC